VAGVLARVAGAGLGALGAVAAFRGLRAAPPGGAERWDRTNHAGESVSLLEGPAFAAGATAALAVAPGIPAGLRRAAMLATAAAGALGAYDDLAGSGDRRGLRGHVTALAHGEVTTGAVKLVGLGLTGLAAARLAGHRGIDVPISGAVVAGAANLVNLLDLRPGRALKLGVAHAVPAILPTSGATVLAPAVGAAAALLPDDLGERTMLGDTGANALGAVLGVGILGAYGRAGRLAHLAAITALTLLSERVSFTKVIESTPVLDALDRWGRRRTPDAG
jgi:UDP-N-acetylmuramyl pentapeptide phosphotransferase/UDP-N-acetylglucosamine-1-phosphate transferase